MVRTHPRRRGLAAQLFRCCAVLALATCAARLAAAQDLLAASGGSNVIVRFDSVTGAPVGTFATVGNLPRFITFGPDFNLYVANHGGGNNVLRFDGATGAPLGVFASGGLSYPVGLAFGPSGDLFVSNCSNADIVRFNGSTGAFMGVFASAPSGTWCNTGLAFGPTGDLLVSEQNSDTIQRYHGTTGVSLGTFCAGNGLDSPEGLAIHGGDLFIANYSGNNVLRFNATTGAFVSVFVFSGSGGLSGPYDLAFGADGKLYVGAYNSSDVRRYNGATGAFIDVFATGGGLSNTAGIAFMPPAQVVTYCTAGTTSHGCVPSISGTGTPSASTTSGFTIAVNGVEGQKLGLIFYGINNSGWTPLTWASGSTSYLCVKPPTQRTTAMNSGGAQNQCNGVLSIDWNAFRANNPAALGQPFTAGQHVYAQGWFRDPPAPKTTNLSNGLEFAVQP